MDIRLKERLIGATVLVLAAVLFIPMVLDGPGADRRISKNVPLPQAGATETRTVRIDLDSGRIAGDEADAAPPATGGEPVTIDLVPEQEAAQASSQDAPAVTDRSQPSSTPKNPEPVADSPTPAAGTASSAESPAGSAPSFGNVKETTSPWTVQVGSFSNQDNADSLVARLHELDFPAYVSRYDDGTRVHYRVRVGGFDSRDAAQQQADLLRRRTGEPARPAPAN